MMAKIKVSEVFGPAGFWEYVRTETGHSPKFNERWGVTQGEGQFVGQRSVFIRTFGCNLTCPSFGLPSGQKTNEPQEFLKDIKIYKSIADVPAAKYGCDSFFSVYPGYKDLSPTFDVEDLAKQAIQAAGGSFFSGVNPVHLILTGGEPMLGWQKAYPELIKKIREFDPIWSNRPGLVLPLTIETNGTQKLRPEFAAIQEHCGLTWSVSPKLTVSGHTHEETIFPEIIRSYHSLSSDMYLKFVAQSVDDLDEASEVVAKYNSVGVYCNVMIMPEGGTVDEFAKHNTLEMVSEAVKRGFNITTRLQVTIGANALGW
jgi:organic radical activating enzyme